MRLAAFAALIVLSASFVPSSSRAAGTVAAPFAGLHFLVGTWNCTYRAGTARFPYGATYVDDRGGHTLRLTTSFTGGGDEELFGYDAHHGWTAVVFEDSGDATIMRGAGSDPNHIPFRSVFPNANITETFDRVSDTEYTLHATERSGGKTTVSVDTCLRNSR